MLRESGREWEWEWAWRGTEAGRAWEAACGARGSGVLPRGTCESISIHSSDEHSCTPTAYTSWYLRLLSIQPSSLSYSGCALPMFHVPTHILSERCEPTRPDTDRADAEGSASMIGAGGAIPKTEARDGRGSVRSSAASRSSSSGHSRVRKPSGKIGRVVSACTSWQKRRASRCDANRMSHRCRRSCRSQRERSHLRAWGDRRPGDARREITGACRATGRRRRRPTPPPPHTAPHTAARARAHARDRDDGGDAAIAVGELGDSEGVDRLEGDLARALRR